jgi:hypothetical protein
MLQQDISGAEQTRRMTVMIIRKHVQMKEALAPH